LYTTGCAIARPYMCLAALDDDTPTKWEMVSSFLPLRELGLPDISK